MDLLGDIGGIKDILILIIGIFLRPISSHSFSISSAQTFFKIKTKDDEISRGTSLNSKKEKKKLRGIKISLLESFKLFLNCNQTVK
jgi:hypothetical protein